MKQCVDMTLKRLNGYSCLIILFLFLLTSCGSVKSWREYNYINGSEFYNDSLNIRVVFFGDTKLYSNNKEVPNLGIGKKNFKRKNVLVHGFCYDPQYDVFLLYRENKNIGDQEDTLILINNKKQQVAYKKSVDGKEVILLLKSTEDRSRKDIINTLIYDGKQLIGSVKINDSTDYELSYFKIFDTYKKNDNILFVYNKLNTAPIESTKQNDWVKFQFIATVLSRDTKFDNFQDLIKDFDKNKKERLNPVIEKLLQNNEQIVESNNAAINKISELSREKRVVMLNELHWQPQHRILAYQLLKPLKNNGYNYLAVEGVTLGNDTILNKRKVPVKTTGYYTNEPYFGLFLREALKLGYEIVAYDNFETDNREKTQALNIGSIFEKDSTAKVFVYAGIDHILEYNSPTKRMAQYFKEETGIDPLTINQVELIGDTHNEITLFNTDVFEGMERINTNVDYFVINNIQPALNQFFEIEEIITYHFQDQALQAYSNTNVYAAVYFQDEYKSYLSNSVPLKNRIIKVKSDKISLDLPVGEYHILIKDINDNIVISKKIEVKK